MRIKLTLAMLYTILFCAFRNVSLAIATPTDLRPFEANMRNASSAYIAPRRARKARTEYG